MKENLLTGAVTELITTFDKNENLDLGMFGDEIDFQLEAGIKGLFCNGLAGESLYTTYEEKIEMTKLTVKKAGGKVPVLGNIVEITTSGGLKMLKSYEDAGVDAICITQPYVHTITQDMLYDYFTELASATKLPVYAYNAPQTSNTMTPGTVNRIVNDNENVIGYKDSTQNIIHLQSLMAGIKKDHFECISGSDATIYPTLAVGGCGIISLISALFPQPIIDTCELYFKGDIKGSYEMQKRVLDIRTALKNAPFMAGYKYAASLIGLSLGIVRKPLCDASDAQKEGLKENLKKLQLI